MCHQTTSIDTFKRTNEVIHNACSPSCRTPNERRRKKSQRTVFLSHLNTLLARRIFGKG